VTVDGLMTAFTRDGHGMRVEKVDGGGTTYYVGGYCENRGATITKYCYLGGQRVVMRMASTAQYLLITSTCSLVLLCSCGFALGG
jgi:hypothetical protein